MTLRCESSLRHTCLGQLSLRPTAGVGPEDLTASQQQAQQNGKDPSMLSPELASQPGANAAVSDAGMNGSGLHHQANGSAAHTAVEHEAMGGGQPLDVTTQKALPAVLIVMFKKHSVVNLTDIRYAIQCQLVCVLHSQHILCSMCNQ